MKKYSFLSALFLLLLTASSFDLPGTTPKKEKKGNHAKVKRCSPIITAYKQASATVSSMQLTFVPTGASVTITNPTFPYVFPQMGNGDYVFKVWFSSVPAQGVYVGLNDLCAPAVNKVATLSFYSTDCLVPFDINITNYQCL
ncbi:hypothetical protein HGH93_10275 [Chitinophaga polysaccharea]|uniref:hypothetical protein n=1 Tax=Chitinophaga TaxID=79328 RepID=UPI00145592DB|nr:MULTISPECIES: hypothetical protein [Chitinophaga]NLR58487.1 hypothetical protein [Chitinophaga polysaccharea]NLU91015.1 hypothetical protein [Chitinophaga sp. Ak27]